MSPCASRHEFEIPYIHVANIEEEGEEDEDDEFCVSGLCYCEMLDELNLMILLIDSTSGERCYLEATLGFMLYGGDEMDFVQVVHDHEKVDRLVSEKIMSREDDRFLSVKLTNDLGFDFCCVFNNFERQHLNSDQRHIYSHVMMEMFNIVCDKIKAKIARKLEEEKAGNNNALEVNEEDLSKALQIKHQIELTFLKADAQAMTE